MKVSRKGDEHEFWVASVSLQYWPLPFVLRTVRASGVSAYVHTSGDSLSVEGVRLPKEGRPKPSEAGLLSFVTGLRPQVLVYGALVHLIVKEHEVLMPMEVEASPVEKAWYVKGRTWPRGEEITFIGEGDMIRRHFRVKGQSIATHAFSDLCPMLALLPDHRFSFESAVTMEKLHVSYFTAQAKCGDPKEPEGASANLNCLYEVPDEGKATASLELSLQSRSYELRVQGKTVPPKKSSTIQLETPVTTTFASRKTPDKPLFSWTQHGKLVYDTKAHAWEVELSKPKNAPPFEWKEPQDRFGVLLAEWHISAAGKGVRPLGFHADMAMQKLHVLKGDNCIEQGNVRLLADWMGKKDDALQFKVEVDQLQGRLLDRAFHNDSITASLLWQKQQSSLRFNTSNFSFQSKHNYSLPTFTCQYTRNEKGIHMEAALPKLLLVQGREDASWDDFRLSLDIPKDGPHNLQFSSGEGNLRFGADTLHINKIHLSGKDVGEEGAVLFQIEDIGNGKRDYYGSLKVEGKRKASIFELDAECQTILLNNAKVSLHSKLDWTTLFAPKAEAHLLVHKISTSSPIAMETFFAHAEGVNLTGELAYEWHRKYPNLPGDNFSRLDITNVNFEIPEKQISLRNFRTSYLSTPDSPNQPQQAAFDAYDAGPIHFTKGRIQYQLPSQRGLLVENIRMNWCGGELVAGALPIEIPNGSLKGMFFADHVSLSKLLKDLGEEANAAKATLTGRVPMVISANGPVLVNGMLFAMHSAKNTYPDSNGKAVPFQWLEVLLNGDHTNLKHTIRSDAVPSSP
ncbi:MAG: hypothetical protein IJJ26_05925 [Victivallales bacterium]|nr:hypothetical protein [Victivallales bacterium]